MGSSLFDRVGGDRWFHDLVARFYDLVETDPVLRPLYPDDLAEARTNLAGFLAQYWGGPPDYTARRGPPQLRLRHLPFRIGQEERDTWVAHMAWAVREGGLPPEDEEEMLAYFVSTATAMINQEAPGRIPVRPAAAATEPA